MLVAGGVIAAGLTGLLVGCDSEGSGRTETSDRNLEVAHVKVDGVTRTCVIYHGVYAGGSVGGLSCKFGDEK